MKKLIIFVSLLFLAMAYGKAEDKEVLKIATFNLRMDTPSDGENAWLHRKDMVNDLIRFYGFDLFGTQEGFTHQLNDILRLSDYRFIGVGRDDGKDAGEHCAIFYRSDRFKVLDQGDFWLSEHPEKPGRGWDGTCCNRICTWGKFEDLKNHKQFYFFNVHYEYEGDVARRESSNLMISRITSIAGNQPVFLTGDFNAFPTEEPIRILNDSGFLNDSYKITKEAPFGPVCTYHGYDSTVKTEERLDYIWVTDSIQIDKYGVLTNTLYGHTPSDHFPVMVVAEF
ncbi:endonuclease/exonuclease/phosphatase family protein [Parabacteroides distasonis]|uniref:endonuclease/exonuclease/phosphatase family protein n=1 Tax=Parabacteroides distasonis TaxID=823 RepID=UPI00189F44E9|nr:endonuclease/exonuclease/phosphatase family protein [Parabacteroides distasonis]MDB9152161.1 endonuclease/exonuclease/phosphatase family protein [Parabacteroides distasonis]MDB9156717.1 endonuclease/exonuclease/phosphatase family protein [Parabacteroides distasonis]MDB9165842.1 endonuclease/exonuclease/phosphatase family protein [Parabacteroides distasonis]MDB9170249.1 endonuclease/exonuclease/phosphatase family protein [Parabacteroides distasonis]MDB9194981.1 endonuclease/exonuclease/phosp